MAKGFISTDWVDKTLLMFNERLNQVEENPSTRTKVFGILVEALQNLVAHRASISNGSVPNVDPQYGLVSVSLSAGEYLMIFGNIVSKSAAKNISARIDQIIKYTPEELKKEYLRVLKNKTFSEKGGAGLGLLDIAKKSNQHFTYHIDDIDDKDSLLFLEIRYSKPL